MQGVRFYQQGQYQSALTQFQQVLARDPRNVDAMYNIAATYHRLGVDRQDQPSVQNAEEMYNRCLDFDQNHVECYRGLAVLLAETGRADRALTLLTNWARFNPQAPDPQVELARLYEERGELKTASLHLQEALQIDQNSSRAWAALAALREREGDPTQALQNYQRSYALNRMQPAVAQRIAALSQQAGSALPLPTTTPSSRWVQGTPQRTPRY